MPDRAIELLKRLDLACANRDLPAARRLMAEMAKAIPSDSEPTELFKADNALRHYAFNIFGWEIK
jgi:hypothetical protein